MDIKDIYALYSKNYLVDSDTRNIRAGSIFFALKGDNFNGNQFAKDAIEKGALYAVVDEKEFHTSENTILVTDVLKTLQNLANYHRKQLDIPIIGLTGSNGKTTTKELINCVLETTYKTNATKGNLNNHIGVPLTLLTMTPETEIGIVEMGANHQKEIEFLASIAEPNFGYITNFGKAHLEGFGGVEGVIKGKSELYQFLKASQGEVFVNNEDEKQLELTKGMNRILLTKFSSLSSSHPFLTINYKEHKIETQLLGIYNYSNIRAAITIGEYFNVNAKSICKAIESYIPDNNRSQIIQKGTNKIILDAYNANPSSVSAALENFHQMKDENKIVILGDMFELGEDSQIEHQAIVDLLDKLEFTHFLSGENFYATTGTNKFKTFEGLQNYFLNNPLKETTILIKGSRGMALERLLDVIN